MRECQYLACIPPRYWCQMLDLPASLVQPDDPVFYPDDVHAGIVGGRDAAGNLLVIHCASSANHVVITGSQGFSSIARPIWYG